MNRSRMIGAVCALTALVSVGCASSAPVPSGNSPATPVTYSLLQSGTASKIEVVTLAEARRVVNTPARPIWVAVDPRDSAATLPEIGTAREVRRAGALRAWAAQSDRGGVCVLLYDPQLSARPATAHSVTASCGTSAELARGVALVQHLDTVARGAVFVVGLAPDGVSQVSVRFGDGRARALPVIANSYSLFAHEPIAGVSFVRKGVRQQTIP